MASYPRNESKYLYQKHLRDFKNQILFIPCFDKAILGIYPFMVSASVSIL